MGIESPTVSKILTGVFAVASNAPVATAILVTTQVDIVTVNGKVWLIVGYVTRLTKRPK